MSDNVIPFVNKTAEEYTSMDEIRQEIDRIDKQLISLIGDRYTLVKAVTQFKKTPEEIKAQARYDAVLISRAKLAAEYELDPDMIEKMWVIMMDWFIEQEIRIITDRDGSLTQAGNDPVHLASNNDLNSPD